MRKKNTNLSRNPIFRTYRDANEHRSVDEQYAVATGCKGTAFAFGMQRYKKKNDHKGHSFILPIPIIWCLAGAPLGVPSEALLHCQFGSTADNNRDEFAIIKPNTGLGMDFEHLLAERK